LIEKAAMLRAAALVARAEAAALDPTMPVAELTKLVNLARRAQQQLPLRPPKPRGLQRARARWEADEKAKAAAQAVEKAGEATAKEPPDARE
jgi:hypothetical protein